MENLAKYMNFLENSRDGGVISNIVIDAIKYHIQSYTGDVDWDEVEESLGAYASEWLIYTQDAIEFYGKNFREIEGIINQYDEPQSIWKNASSVSDAIGAVCCRAYDIVLSDIVKKLKAL